MAAITLEGVTRVFAGGVRAIDGLDLCVPDGELLVLLGPSGSGKTTTLRLIAGLDRASGGTIRLGQQKLNDLPPQKRNMSMVFQHGGLFPHMSVFGNLAFGLRMRHRHPIYSTFPWFLARTNLRRSRAVRRWIDRRVHHVARKLDVENLLQRRPGELSGGQRQRIAVGRALTRRPAAHLFDEPLANLDAPARLRIRHELKQMHARLGVTTIYVTHDQAEAMSLGTRIAILDGGRLQQVGTPLEVYSRPANRFVAGFVGSPPMNFLPGRLQPSPGGLSVQTEAGPVPVDRTMPERVKRYVGGDVVLGIRPENVTVGPETVGVRPATSWVGEVAWVEPMGAAAGVFVHVAGYGSGGSPSTTGGAAMWAVLPAAEAGSIYAGQRVRLTPQGGEVLLFDRRTGSNIAEAP